MRSLQCTRWRLGRGEVGLICGALRLCSVAYVVRRCVRLEQAAKARTASALTRGQRASRHSKAGSRARVCTPAPVTPRQRCSVRALSAGAHLLSLCTQGWVQREVVSKQALASSICGCMHSRFERVILDSSVVQAQHREHRQARQQALSKDLLMGVIE